METISYHNNQSSYPTRTKNTIYVEAYVLSMYAKFQLHPPYGLCEEDLLIFFQKYTLHVAPATNQIINKRFGQKAYETWRTTQ